MKKIVTIVFCITVIYWGVGFVGVNLKWRGDHSEFPIEKAYEYLKKYGMGVEWKKCQVLLITAYNINNRKTWSGVVWIDNNFNKDSFLQFDIKKRGDVLVEPILGDDSYWDIEGREKGCRRRRFYQFFNTVGSWDLI